MKIMFINSVVDYGSTGKIVRDLANGLKSQGHELLIAYGRKESKNSQDTFNLASKLGFINHVFMTRLFDRHGLHSSRATKKLINKIEFFKPDVIHLHNLHGYYLNYPKLMNYLKKQKQIKIIWTLHDLWAVSGSPAHFSYYGCKLWDEGCVIANNPRVYPQSLIFLREKKNFDLKKEVFSGFQNMTIVTVSDWQKDIIKKTFLKQYPVVRIYNGIDFKKYDNVLEIKKDKHKIFGTASVWNDEKNLKDYIKLAKILPNKYNIILAGLNKKQIERLPNNILGLKRFDDEEALINTYAKSSVFINLSLQETMGMTTVEALASGTPVIVYDQTALPEIVEKSIGEIVESGSIENLFTAIENIEARKIDPEICHTFAKERYNKTKMIENYLELYNPR